MDLNINVGSPKPLSRKLSAKPLSVILTALLSVMTPPAMAQGKADTPSHALAYIEVRSIAPADDAIKSNGLKIVTYGLKYEDVEKIRTIPAIAKAVPVRSFAKQVRHLQHTAEAEVVGTTSDFATLIGLEMDRGRRLTEVDNDRFANHVVIGAAVATDLFPEEDPTGKPIKVGSDYYTVVGVAKERARTQAATVSIDAGPVNPAIYVPLNTCKLRFGERLVDVPRHRAEECQLSRLVLELRDGVDVGATAAQVRSTLELTHPKKDVEVVIIKPKS